MLADRAVFGRPDQFSISDLVRDGCTIDHALAASEIIKARLNPLSVADPQFKDPRLIDLRDALGKIGERIRPEMAGEAAKRWVASQIDAIKGLPYEVAIEAANRANADPDLQHPNQVSKIIHKHVPVARLKFETGIRRCRGIIDAIKTPQIEKKPPPPSMVQADIDRMASGSDLQKSLLALGVAKGYVVRDDSLESGYRLVEIDDAE